MTAAKLPTDGSPVTITGEHIRALGSCESGVRMFRRAFPNGVTLDQATLDKYYRSPFTTLKGLHHSANWVFSRVNISAAHAERRSPTDVLYYSREPGMVKARKAIRAVERKRETAQRAAVAAVNKKFAPLLAKARSNGTAVARAWITSKKKKTPALTLNDFATRVNSTLMRYR